MPGPPEALTALRGLHLPPVEMMADAPAIALSVAVGLAAALAIAGAWGMVMESQRSVRRGALDALAQSSGLAPNERLVAQAKLLRRLVRTLDGDASARQRWDAWAKQLDRTFRTDFFSRGEGRHYVEGLYRAGLGPDPAFMEAELATLFKRIRR